MVQCAHKCVWLFYSLNTGVGHLTAASDLISGRIRSSPHYLMLDKEGVQFPRIFFHRALAIVVCSQTGYHFFFSGVTFGGSVQHAFHWWAKHLLQIILIFFFVFVTLLQLASFEGSMARYIHHHPGLKWQRLYPLFIEFLVCQILCMFSPKRRFRNPHLISGVTEVWKA